jgi:N6-adenosine-specific RNA methylase IME4
MGASVRYRTIVADPPWDHSDGTGIVISVGMDHRPREDAGYVTAPLYPTLTVDEIAALPVAALADRNAHLYLWTTNRYLRHVWDIAEAWGFKGVCILTWCKARRGFLGGGAFPSDTEFCLFARRGSLTTLGRAPGRWYEWPRTRGAPVKEGQRRDAVNGSHSAKPEAFLDLVEQVSPGPYLEMFSRRARLGWDTHGNESLQQVSA